jgi:hypothetical protein
VLPPSDVAKAAEVIREKFALRFWKLKVRIFFQMVQETLQGAHTSSGYGRLERRQVCADRKLQESVCTLLEGYVMGSKGK